MGSNRHGTGRLDPWVRSPLARCCAGCADGRGLTQDQPAERAGLSPRAVRALELGERGRRYPHTVRVLAAALNLGPAELDELTSASGTLAARPELPLPSGRIIGREADLRAVTKSASEGKRMLTLTGPVGVGKTRLALAAAAEVAPHSADGCVFVPLSDVRSASGVVTAVARRLALRDSDAVPLPGLLYAYLPEAELAPRDRQHEHLLAAAPDLAAVAAAGPRLATFVTSRAPLGGRCHGR